MPVPTIVGNSAAAANGVDSITPAYPLGYTATADDIALTFVESATTDTVNAPTGWAVAVAQSQTTGLPTKLTALWRRVQAGDTAPTIVDPGTNDHMVGRMIILRGCVTTGNPWDVALGGVDNSTTTAWTVTGSVVTTTVIDTLLLIVVATGQDVASTANISGYTNTSLTLTERMDNWVTAGHGGGFGLATAPKAAAGQLTTNTTGTLVTGNTKAWLQIALKPALVVPGAPSLVVARYRR